MPTLLTRNRTQQEDTVDEVNLTNVVQSSNRYDQFSVIDANRDVVRGHVERIKKAMEEGGNLTQVQPILVNENLEIIDGQHRFVAVQELGEPVFYTVVPGLRVDDARRMNIVHRQWTSDDFLKSYVAAGLQDYIKFKEFREDFGLTHSNALLLAHMNERNGIYKEFREGDFHFVDYEKSREWAGRLMELQELAGFKFTQTMTRAWIRVFAHPDYDHNHMVSKMQYHGAMFNAYVSVEDNLRAIEELYNYRSHEGNRTRLF